MTKHIFSPDGLYARVMNGFWNILVLSVLWMLCCLPVVTLGAASTAAYYAAAKVIRRKTGKIYSEFFVSFRRNFRQSVPLTLVVLLLNTVLAVECLYLYADTRIPAGVLYLFAAMLLAVCAMGSYLWACLSRFSMGSFQLFRMAVVLTFRHLLTTLLLLALLCVCLLGIYRMPWGILVFPGLALYLSTYPMEKILLRYSPKVSPDDPEAQKWYYGSAE